MRFFSLLRESSFLRVFALLPMVGVAPSIVLADAAPPSKVAPAANVVRGDEITPAQQDSVRRGLQWLADHQARDGSWGGGQDGAAVTALGALAMMQAGNLPGRGQYGTQVQKALDYVLKNCQESGLVAAENANSPMYGHGFATLFLGEVYGMTGDETVKEKLQRAIRLIQRTQNAEGGWRYQPVPNDADVSVTICQMMALRAARDAGIKVEKEVIDKGVAYVRNCQSADGGFRYQVAGSTPSMFPRSAAGVATMYYAGIFEGEDLNKGLKYVARFQPGKGGAASEGHYFYGHYYACQVMFLAGGEMWAKWYPAIREELIRMQSKPGSWNGDYTEDYCTAMALIILQMPNRYLPVYNGKGPGS